MYIPDLFITPLQYEHTAMLIVIIFENQSQIKGAMGVAFHCYKAGLGLAFNSRDVATPPEQLCFFGLVLDLSSSGSCSGDWCFHLFCKQLRRRGEVQVKPFICGLAA